MIINDIKKLPIHHEDKKDNRNANIEEKYQSVQDSACIPTSFIFCFSHFPFFLFYFYVFRANRGWFVIWRVH